MIKKITTGLATAAILASAMTPMVFAADNEISGNGSDSTNKIILSDTNTTTVGQSNSSTVGNTISSVASTGGNKANSNTGGDVSITTGNAENTTTVSTTTGGNIAHIALCCGCNGGSNLISGNGESSYNKIKKTTVNSLTAGQSNGSLVGNTVYSKAKTGKNKAKKNTNGTVGITTGDATNTTSVGVLTGDNTLSTTPGCCCCNGSNGSNGSGCCDQAHPPGI